MNGGTFEDLCKAVDQLNRTYAHLGKKPLPLYRAFKIVTDLCDVRIEIVESLKDGHSPVSEPKG